MSKLSPVKTLLLCIGLYSQPTLAEPITLCYEEQDYRPYLSTTTQNTDDKTGLRGMFPDMALLAGKQAGIEVRFITSSWKRCIDLVRTGRADGMFAAIYKAEREKWAAYPRTEGKIDIDKRLWTVDYNVYSHRNSPLTWNGTDFQHVTNGVDAPIAYFTYDQLKKMAVLPARNSLPEKGLQLLALQRLDGYVLEQFTAESLINRLKLNDQLKSHQPLFASENLYLVLSKQWAGSQSDRAEAFWSALAKVREQQGQNLLRTYLR